MAAPLLERLRSSSAIIPTHAPVPATLLEPAQRPSAVFNKAAHPHHSGVTFSRAKASTKNLRFLILVRILLRDLERTGDHALKDNLTWLVQECIRRCSNKEAGFSPLELAAETVIKATVGTSRWKMAHDELEKMMMQRRRGLISSTKLGNENDTIRQGTNTVDST
jgi:hypothetical protein